MARKATKSVPKITGIMPKEPEDPATSSSANFSAAPSLKATIGDQWVPKKKSCIGYSEKKIKDNLGSEILGIIANDSIINFGQKKTFQIDTTDSTPKTIVSKIDDIINRCDNGDDIDWLPLIQEKNDFKTFFEY